MLVFSNVAPPPQLIDTQVLPAFKPTAHQFLFIVNVL